MLITCPKCTASYRVDAGAIGARGRSVRCVPCETVWFVTPPAVESLTDTAVAAFRAALADDTTASAEKASAVPPEGEARLDAPDAASAAVAPPESDADALQPQREEPTATAPVDAATASKDTSIALLPGPAAQQSGAHAIDGEPHDVESLAARRQARLAARQRAVRLPMSLPAAIFILAVISAGLLGWRKDIVRHAPQMGSLYAAIGLPVNLRGLAFTDVKVVEQTHDGVPLLVVEGFIVSTVSVPVEVPRLRFAIRNAAGSEVYAWTAMPTQLVLQPGETLPFRSRLASPPSGTRDVEVRFFTRRDSIAGLR
jgi:predicted Zn finger-like uncharacterized protein